jgi:hypothetical protein
LKFPVKILPHFLCHFVEKACLGKAAMKQYLNSKGSQNGAQLSGLGGDKSTRLPKKSEQQFNRCVSITWG